MSTVKLLIRLNDIVNEIQKVIVMTKDGKYYECDDIDIEFNTLVLGDFGPFASYVVESIKLKLKQHLTTFQSVEIDLSSAYFGYGGIDELVKTLEEFGDELKSKLIRFRASGSNIDENSATKLSSYLKLCPNILSIDL